MMNISTHGHSRFQEKLDKFFWFAIMFLPILFWLFLNVGRAFMGIRAEESKPLTYEDYTYSLSIDHNDLTLLISENLYDSSFNVVFYPVGYFGDELPLQLTVKVFDNFNEDIYANNTDLFFTGYSMNASGLIECSLYKSEHILNITLNESMFNSMVWINNRCLVDNSTFNFSFIIPPESSAQLVLNNPIYFERTLIPEEEVADDNDGYISMNYVMCDLFGMDIESAPVSIIGDVFNGIFAKDGIFPFFKEDSGLTYYFIYFVIVQIIHVLIDVLVFIPRFAHKVLSKAIDFGG